MPASRRSSNRSLQRFGIDSLNTPPGADWLYAQFYRLDRILSRFARAVFTVGWMSALLSLKLGLTYRYDNKREGVAGWNPTRVGHDRHVPLMVPRSFSVSSREGFWPESRSRRKEAQIP